MKMLCLTMFLLFMMLPQGSAFPERSGNAPEGDNHVERYHYEAVPIGEENDKEDIGLVLSFEANGIGFASTAVSEKAEERIRVKMTREGDLISGARSLAINSSRRLTEGKIWRDENKVYIEQISGKGKKTKTLDIPKGATLAVEGSLLVLLRFFPYESATRWDLFMIDFSGTAVAATARQAGVERIAVPAGEFPCYRMEVLFHIFILSPKVVCWVTTEKPHVVIRSVGKRGVFTPTYITSLIGEQFAGSVAARQNR
ncbi:MAG: hypothetical protein ABSC19_02450 [Syntrophorhabdales bacterium]|jgi:hypothetical protein